jgi:hypothetical protein
VRSDPSPIHSPRRTAHPVNVLDRRVSVLLQELPDRLGLRAIDVRLERERALDNREGQASSRRKSLGQTTRSSSSVSSTTVLPSPSPRRCASIFPVVEWWTNLVARETNGDEPFVPVLLVQGLQVLVLRGET